MSLELSGVEVRRGGRALLAGIDLTFEPGLLTAVLGPNGAGKSTLLRVASGELAPDAGAARLDGEDLASWDLGRLAQRRAVLAQLSGLEFPFTVREVVALGRHPHGDAGTPKGDAAIRRALVTLELERLEGASYPQLSGGERQRTHAARALAQIDGTSPPGWLLLDEPTSALDLVHQHRLMGQLRSHTRAGGGALAVLHDPNLAAAYADRLVLLAEGRVERVGAVREVLEPGILERVYGVPVEVLELPGRDHPVIIAAPRGEA